MGIRFSSVLGLHRDAKIIIASNALRNFISSILTVAFSLYLAKLGASPVLIGLTFTGRSLFTAVRSLGEGIVADRIGRKPILLFTAALMIVGGIVFAYVTDITALILVAVLFSVGGVITYTPAEVAMLSEKVESGERTMVFSLNSTISAAAAILGGFTAGLPDVLQRFGFMELDAYRVLFLILAAMGLSCFILFSFLRESFVRKEANMQEKPAPVEVPIEERKFLIKWSGVLALDNIGGGFNELINYWFYLRYGVGPSEIGLLNAASNILALFSYTLGLKMAKRVGTIRATVLSRVPIVLTNVLTPFMPTFGTVAIVRLVNASFGDIDVPLRQSYLMGVTRPESRASTYGVLQVVTRFMGAWTPSIAAYMYQFVNLTVSFFGAAGFQFASLASMYLLFKDIRPPEERAEPNK